ncbi:metalloregulator ArsR/SmtB family transcription factor [Vibrio cholerae]|nr:metalloregulator ArsR/SmtB family transcription factor [Vibrio cholerae]
MTMNYDVHQHDEAALIFRALAEPTRLSLIHCLADGPHRVGELSAHLGLAQSTVSAHLAVLRSTGLVSATPDGRATLYRLSHPGLDDLLHAGERLLAHDSAASSATGGSGSSSDHIDHDSVSTSLSTSLATSPVRAS